MPCKLFDERHVVDVLQDKPTEGVAPARPVAAGIGVCQRVVVNVRIPVQALGVARPRHDGIRAEPSAGEGIIPPRRQGEARQIGARVLGMRGCTLWLAAYCSALVPLKSVTHQV